MNVLISGAGIAGPTLAYWLLEYGHAPTLVEFAPQLRTGGYLIDFWGIGFDIAEKMGILPELMRAGYVIEGLKFVDAHGRRVGGFAVDVLRAATRGRYVSLPRGELAASIYRAIKPRAKSWRSSTWTRIPLQIDGAAIGVELGEPRHRSQACPPRAATDRRAHSRSAQRLCAVCARSAKLRARLIN